MKKKVLAISGSTRKNSSNHKLIHAIAAMATNEMDTTLFESIADLPHFNPDDNIDPVPAAVLNFRNRLHACDAVLICTPEYAHGFPGVLKNAIDWVVSSNEFSHKPTALITASTDGRAGHASLIEVLKTIEAENIEQLNLLIQFIQTKINSAGDITDAVTKSQVETLLKNLVETIDNIHSQ